MVLRVLAHQLVHLAERARLDESNLERANAR
jgi:hypothetical protein